MFPPAQNMASPLSRPSPPPVAIDLATNENAIQAFDLLQNMSSTLKEIRDALKLNNANEERGGPAKNMSDTLEQPLDNGQINLDDANKNLAASIEGSPAKNMSDTLGHILEVLKGSNIAEERGKDDDSKFWATYKKVSTEYDDDFLERANDDMGIILTFAGLFSAVNSTFIIGMQPNPGDTTNALLLYIIQLTVNGPNSVPDINTLSSSTLFPSSTVWIQSLSYASLTFSVLAAFGAVLGKQWLNSYKVAREGETLEERGIERQMKLDGIEYFRLQTILQTFLILLQMSLVLFCLSLSAHIWVLQTTISSVIICVTAFGILFYVGTFLLSVLRLDSPFQTPASEGLAPIFQKILPRKFKFTPKSDVFAKSSAIRWILETSTNPDIVETAAAIIPRMQWRPNLDASAAFARLRHNFMACEDKAELYLKYGKAIAHLYIQPVKIKKELLEFQWNNKFQGTQSRFIRDAFMAGRAAYERLKSPEKKDDEKKHQADTRTALRTMLVHGMDKQLSRPDDEALIWWGNLRWYVSAGGEPSCEEEEFDWLVDYLEGDAKDDKTKGDALLALSAMQGLGSPTKQQSYISSLIRCMGPTEPPRVRHTSLRAVFEAREALASMTSALMPEGVDAQLLDKLSRALLTAVRPNNNVHDTGPDASFHEHRDTCYLDLIRALIKNDEWYQRLIRDGHLRRCISLVDRVSHQQRGWYSGFCLLVIIGHIKSSHKDLPFSPAEERWRSLIAHAWSTVQYNMEDDLVIDGIPALVTATRMNLKASYNSVPRGWFADCAVKVHEVWVKLQEKQATLVKGGVARAKVDTAIPNVQGLHDELTHMVKKRNTSQGLGFGIVKDIHPLRAISHGRPPTRK